MEVQITVLSCREAHSELGAEPGLESMPGASQTCVPGPGCFLSDYGIRLPPLPPASTSSYDFLQPLG